MINRLSGIIFQRETLTPVLALSGVSAIAVTLVMARMFLTDSLRHGYLIWNLFLAWVPLFFCLAALKVSRAPLVSRWKFWTLATAWLLFLPNAPYIVTDLIHLRPRLFWVDLVLIVLCAWIALVLGFLSLYLMQNLVSRRCGALGGWAFAALVSGLTGVGIYIGRFLRWNSWDVLVNPIGIMNDIFQWAMTSFADKRLAVYPALFALLSFAAHVTLSALLHLRVQPIDNDANQR